MIHILSQLPSWKCHFHDRKCFRSVHNVTGVSFVYNPWVKWPSLIEICMGIWAIYPDILHQRMTLSLFNWDDGLLAVFGWWTFSNPEKMWGPRTECGGYFTCTLPFLHAGTFWSITMLGSFAIYVHLLYAVKRKLKEDIALFVDRIKWRTFHHYHTGYIFSSNFVHIPCQWFLLVCSGLKYLH